MKPTVHGPTAWHSSERSENGCDLLYTPVSELGRLWAFKGDCRHELLRATPGTGFAVCRVERVHRRYRHWPTATTY
eukprot:scaffold42204_cov74-Phaeocystis_antarctica.AAC.1